MKPEYRIIKQFKLEPFIAVCQQEINQGSTPLGGPVIIPVGSNNMFFQAFLFTQPKTYSPPDEKAKGV